MDVSRQRVVVAAAILARSGDAAVAVDPVELKTQALRNQLEDMWLDPQSPVGNKNRRGEYEMGVAPFHKIFFPRGEEMMALQFADEEHG